MQGRQNKEREKVVPYSIIIDTLGVAYWLLAHMTLSTCLSSIRKGGLFIVSLTNISKLGNY